jgi:HEAT repeat protein
MKPLITLVATCLVPSLAWAYAVAPPVPLDALEKEAHVIFKGTVLSSAKTTDDSFKAYPSWAVFATRMKVISVLKGDPTAREVEFHHYDDDPAPNIGRMFAPQHYHFEIGRSYIVFAKATKTPGMFRPVWDAHRGKEDQGQVLAADDKPIGEGLDLKGAIWAELTRLAASERPAADVRYAIAQLHLMSGVPGRFDSTADFPRDRAVAVIAPLIAHKDSDVAIAAIDAVGSRSPYLLEDNMGWLATVGKGKLLERGHAKYPEKWDNADACKLTEALVAVADKGTSASVRARAIRALGLCGDKSLLQTLGSWSADPAPEVRAAAATLWADFPGDQANGQLGRLAGDPDAGVRRSAAAAVGCLQSSGLLGVLEGLLRDRDSRVREVAAMSAISFDPKQSGELLKTFRKDPDFGASFVNALALDDPRPYLDELARIIRANDEPKLHFVAQMPVYTSWQILKADLESRPVAELTGGQLDEYLDALDYPPDIGSGPFQETYQFYVERGMSERAARFRESAKRRVTSYDLDYFFKRVDQSPNR